MSLGKFIRNRDHILRRDLSQRFLQISLQFRVIGSRLLLDDVTLPLHGLFTRTLENVRYAFA